jgi:hypothetical protein
MLLSVHQSAARDIASRFVCSDTATRLDACNCGRNHVNDATLRARRDPSQTLDLRQRFMRVMDKRWRNVTKMVTEAVVTADMFGLRSTSAMKLQIISMSSGQVQAFQNWIDGALAELILGSDREQWIGEYTRAAYLRGWTAAKSHVGHDLPLNVDRADILTKLTISELQGVMEAFSQRAVRAFSDGLMHHLPPAKIARTLRKSIASIGIVRSRATVQTMMVSAAAQASLDYYQLAGVSKVGVLPETVPSPARSFRLRDAKRKKKSKANLVEVITAGDDDVCVVCQDIADGNPYTIAEARSLIPAHPWCRCAFVPLDDARFTHGDAETFSEFARDGDAVLIDLELVVSDDYDPDEPRNESGEWESGGGGGKSGKWAAGKKGNAPLSAIKTSQAASETNKEQVKSYREQIRSGKKLAPLEVVYTKEDKKFRLLDGHHRYLAYKAEGVKKVPVRVAYVAPTVKKANSYIRAMRFGDEIFDEPIEVNFAYRAVRTRDGFKPGQVFCDRQEARLAFDVAQLGARDGEQVWEVDITGIEGATADQSAVYLPAGTSFEVVGYDELAKVWMVCATASQ